MYDHEGVWCGGIECYMKKYQVWIPDRIARGDKDAIENYVEQYFESVFDEAHRKGG